MVNVEDFVVLSCTHELIGGGLDYARRSLPNLRLRSDRAGYAQVRRVAAAAAVELAFRRHLIEQGVPFEVSAPPAFSDPNRFLVTLQGRRCNLRSFLITDQRQVASIGVNPALLLDVPALVPVEDYADENKSPQDLYVFAVLPAVVQGRAGVHAKSDAEARHGLMHLLPMDWAHPRAWAPLGMLRAKYERGGPMQLEIAGQDSLRQPLVHALEIRAGALVEVVADFYNITYTRVQARPAGRLGLHAPGRAKTLIIEPADWHDVWFEAHEIILLGWLRREEFRQRASLIHAGRRVFQFSRTRMDDLAVDVADLKPMRRLLERSAGTG